MVALGYLPGTYTEVAFRDARTWVFKDCQPAPGMPATCALSLTDGTAHLLPYARKDQLIVNGYVNFLPGDLAPAHGAPLRTERTDFRQLALTNLMPAAPACPVRTG